MNKQPKRQAKAIKAWAVIGVDNQILVSGSLDSPQYRYFIFPKKQSRAFLDKYYWAWKVVPVLISALPAPKETKKGKTKK